MRENIKRNKIAMLLLGGVAVFFMGCEKEGLGEPGELVPIHFSLSGEDYGGSQVRSGRVGGASETVIVPLDDKYCIYATLAEDTAAQLRDFETIATNTKVMIVVFEGTTVIANQEYKVDNANGDIVPVVAPGISVPSNVTYTFVAYSINTTNTMAAYVDPLVMGPDDDLLWGHEPDVYVGPGGVSLTIGMRHKFSQVTVKASLTSIPAGATLGVPSNVTITPGYEASLNVRTGQMGKGATFAQPVSSWTGPSPVFTAASRRVFTAVETPVSVTIGSVTVGSMTYTNRVAKFDIPLAQGYKYTLTADLKKTVVWAGSNIYWDSSGQKLTFDAPTTDVSTNSPQRKQGVLFKWGSLIGISPARQGDIEYEGEGGSQTYLGFSDYGTNTTLYIPNVVTTPFQHTDWYDIPFVSEIVLAGSNYDSYLSDEVRNNGYYSGTSTYYWGTGRGDICRYISEGGNGPGGATNKYRLPTRAEMGEKSSYSYGSDGWTKRGGYSNSLGGGNGVADGTTLLDDYASNSYGNIIFPFSGIRAHQYYPGLLSYVYDSGAYWSSSIGASSWASGLYFAVSYNYVGSSSFYVESNGAASVRCVRAN
jgi:hypothetical protein